MKLDFVSNRVRFYVLSIVAVCVCVLIVAQNGLNLSIEFRSGSVMRLRFESQDADKISPKKITEVLARERFKETFAKLKIQEVEASQTIGETGREFFVTSNFIPEQTGTNDMRDQVEREFQKEYPTTTTSEFRNIGPSIGSDLKVDAIKAIFFSILVIILYITIRFDFRFSIVSIIALVHDVLIVLGLFALLNKEFSPSTIAAILTIIGYSLNDSIVILDRIRENMRLMRKTDFGIVVNTSVNQSLSRTVRTSLTTLCPIIILLLWGGVSISNFCFAMMMGVIAGTYSSVCIVAPILVSWDKAGKSGGNQPKAQTA